MDSVVAFSIASLGSCCLPGGILATARSNIQSQDVPDGLFQYHDP